MDIEVLTDKDKEYIRAMYTQWSGLKSRNSILSARYDGKIPVSDLGISVPPPMASKLSRPSLLWSRQAIRRPADSSILLGFKFSGNEPEGFSYVMEANSIIDKYDETLPSQLTHGVSFWTVTGGGPGEPPVIISSYDALHATALFDFRANRVLCGLCIVDVDPTEPDKITAFNYYAPNGDIVEFEMIAGTWQYRRLKSAVGRCCMEVMRNEPDKAHPFGKSIITPSIESLEDEANREVVRMILHAEYYTSPTRYILGADDDLFEGHDRWEVYSGSILALPAMNEDGTLPATGQYQQGSMQPHISYIRQLANQFAAEASIPIHSLLYTEANPASAEAIEASRHDLVEKVTKLNRINGATLKRIALLACSIMTKTPVSELDEELKTLEANFKNPVMPSLAATADAAYKIAKAEPDFVHQKHFWQLLGYTDTQIEEILPNLHSGGDAND